MINEKEVERAAERQGNPESPLEMATLLRELRKSILGPLGNNLLLHLLRQASARVHAPGDVLCHMGEPLPGFWLVLDGAVDVVIPRPEREDVVAELRAGEVVGCRGMLADHPSLVTYRVDAASPAKLLFFSRQELEAMILSSGAAREALWESLPPPMQSALDKAEVLQLVTSLPGLPLGVMTLALARTIAADFPNDRVLVLDTAAGGPQAPERRQDGVWYAAGSDPRAYPDFDYVFVIGPLPAGVKLDTAVVLTHGLPAPVSSGGASNVLVTVLVSPSTPVRRHGLTGASDGRNPQLAMFDGVWIDLDPSQLPLQANADLSLLSAAVRANLSRWARAVTHRRVGIALSGGGAWGFYHSVILRELAKRDVPIDIVTSASMGSVFGAYYSVLGLQGLDLVYERTKSMVMTLYALASIFTTASIQRLVTQDLGERYLEQLVTRFHPVTTDLASGTGVVALEGELGLAVRASSSAPGVWAPTLLSPERWYVDGCVANDVPVSWLAYLGADLTFASNCYPGGLRKYRQLLPGALGRFIASNNVLNRVVDLSTSGSIMLHRNGYVGGDLANTFFDVHSARGALIDAMNFNAVDRIIQEAEDDPKLHEAVDEFAAQWTALKNRGRSGGTPFAPVSKVDGPRGVAVKRA